MKKSSMMAVSALALGTAGLIGLSQVANATTKNTSSGLAEAIASKFNLNKDEVQKVVDEHRASAKMQKEGASKAQIEQLVKDAKLTQEQADAITAKREELKKARQEKKASSENSDKSSQSSEERRAQKEARNAEIDKWLEEKGIDKQYRYLLSGRGKGAKGAKGEKTRAQADSSTTKTTVQGS